MNTKSFIVAIVLFLSIIPVNLFAVDSEDQKNEWNKNLRSISSPLSLSLSITENVIYIYSIKQIDDLCIQIKDSEGNILYTEIGALLPKTEHAISLDTLQQGEYQILLTQGNNYLIENFIK